MEVFNSLRNICLELLAESVGVGVVLGSGELSLESSVDLPQTPGHLAEGPRRPRGWVKPEGEGAE